MQRELLRGFLALMLAMGFTACSTDDDDCADSEKVCADGTAPSADFTCGEDETPAICPAADAAGHDDHDHGGAHDDDHGGAHDDEPAGGEVTTGGTAATGGAADADDKVVGTPENPAALGEACVMADGEAGICVSDMTTTCQVALNGSPCEGVNNGCCPDGKSMPKNMSMPMAGTMENGGMSSEDGGSDDTNDGGSDDANDGGSDDTNDGGSADTNDGGSDDTDNGGSDDTGTDNGGSDDTGTDNGGSDDTGTDNGGSDDTGTDNGGSDDDAGGSDT